MSPLVAGLAGFLLGVAGTITLAMADKQTRIRTSKKADELKKSLLQWSDDTVNNIQKTSYVVRKDLANKIDPDVKDSQQSEAKDEVRREQLHN